MMHYRPLEMSEPTMSELKNDEFFLPTKDGKAYVGRVVPHANDPKRVTITLRLVNNPSTQGKSS